MGLECENFSALKKINFDRPNSYYFLAFIIIIICKKTENNFPKRQFRSACVMVSSNFVDMWANLIAVNLYSDGHEVRSM